MKEKPIRKEIITLIEQELNNIIQLGQELKKYKDKNSQLYRRAKGSVLHDFYNSCERIFKIILKEIDGNRASAVRWHKELLNRMRIEMPGIRPRVISEKLASELNEYLSFRHLFRNIYGFELASGRLNFLVEKFEKVSKQFISEIKKFLKFL
ncbi:hypothetical protein J7K43_08745 [Candidatus Calescamantes bacterium]|nr:hypothetical protein [Candidatus Calescamantes bacterium]